MIIFKLLIIVILLIVALGFFVLFFFLQSFSKIKKQFDNLGKQHAPQKTTTYQTKPQRKPIFDKEEGEYIDFEEEKAEKKNTTGTPYI